MEDTKVVTYSCKISKRQKDKIDFYKKLGVNPSIFGFLGVESIIALLDEILRDFGEGNFIKRLINPPSLYSYKYLLDGLPINERIKLKIFEHNGKKGGKI